MNGQKDRCQSIASQWGARNVSQGSFMSEKREKKLKIWYFCMKLGKIYDLKIGNFKRHNPCCLKSRSISLTSGAGNPGTGVFFISKKNVLMSEVIP